MAIFKDVHGATNEVLAPRRTKAMHVVIEDLGLDRLFVVYPGTQRYPLDKKIEAMPLSGLKDDPLRR